tara:strand:+ start:74 stop:538 length:465 start_codon:yes stop_codon:yes gene_type:complete
MIRSERRNKKNAGAEDVAGFMDQRTTGRRGRRSSGRRQRQSAMPAAELPMIGMRVAEAADPMRQQFQQQDTAQRNPRRRSRPGMFGDRRLGGMFGGNRGRRGGARLAQRAVMEGMGMRGPTGIREGGLVKIASEKSKAKKRKMERRGYGAARKP